MEFVLILFVGVMNTGGIWMIFKVFKDSTKAGLAWLFVPFYSIYYLVNHWDEMKKPFYIWLAGTVGMILVAVISGFEF